MKKPFQKLNCRQEINGKEFLIAFFLKWTLNFEDFTKILKENEISSKSHSIHNRVSFEKIIIYEEHCYPVLQGS